MRSLQEAKGIAEVECTETTNKYRKTSRFAIRVIVVVIALSLRSVGLTDLITERRQLHGIWGESSSSQLTNQGCPHYSSLADQGCTVTEKPIILVTEEATWEGESELCYLKPEGAVLLTRKVGVNSFEFKSANGVFPIRYKLIRRTELINGKCPKKF